MITPGWGNITSWGCRSDKGVGGCVMISRLLSAPVADGPGIIEEATDEVDEDDARG